jgi:hypothetical protein
MPKFRRPPEEVEAELNRLCITHVVLGSLGVSLAKDSAFRAAVEAQPAHFEPVWASRDFSVFRFVALRSSSCPPTIPRATPARKSPAS